jgi:N6-adenosine-specific RNA methylase IME4
MKLPTTPGGFAFIDADPPWLFRSYAPPVDLDASRAIEKHYPTMSIDEIKAMPVAEICAPDSHLALWATGPTMPQALEVMTSWGFTYSGFFLVWFKLRRGIADHQLCIVNQIESELHMGLGYTTRKNVEVCLLGRRGKPKRLAKDVREVVPAPPHELDHEPLVAPVRQHSRKPDEAYRRMERYAAGPYLQLFGRESRPGWTVWGNEAEKFDGVAS